MKCKRKIVKYKPERAKMQYEVRENGRLLARFNRKSHAKKLAGCYGK